MASYSKTRLGSDQEQGAISLSPRGKRIVILVVALIVAAGVAVGVWSGVSHDEYSTSANGCVSLTTSGPTGGQLYHACGQQAEQFCKQAFTDSDGTALQARAQCDAAGLTKAKVDAG